MPQPKKNTIRVQECNDYGTVPPRTMQMKHGEEV